MTTWDKFVFLYQINGAEELGKKVGSSEPYMKRIFRGEKAMSKNIKREIEELYALRELCLAKAAMWREAHAISLVDLEPVSPREQ